MQITCPRYPTPPSPPVWPSGSPRTSSSPETAPLTPPLVLQAIDVDPDFGAALKQQAFLLRLLSSFVTLDRPLDPAAPRLPVFVKTTHGKRRAGG